MNYLPLLTSLVAFAFTLSLARQYVERRKFHQALWTFAMLFYGIAALMEFLMNPDVLGASVVAFRVYYVLSAPLVGLLGAGVMYLLAKKRWADYFLGVIALLSIALAVTGWTTPLDRSIIVESFSGELGEAFRAAVHAYPMTVRRFAIIINKVGGLVLIGGAAIGFFGDPNFFFEFELGGTVFLYLGFLYSDRYIKAREAKIASALERRKNEE